MHARFFRQDPDGGMNWSQGIRRAHRVLAIAFTAPVIANTIAFSFGQPPAWLVYSPLPPLFLLMFSGLYMLALPHVRRWRGGRAGS